MTPASYSFGGTDVRERGSGVPAREGSLRPAEGHPAPRPSWRPIAAAGAPVRLPLPWQPPSSDGPPDQGGTRTTAAPVRGRRGRPIGVRVVSGGFWTSRFPEALGCPSPLMGRAGRGACVCMRALHFGVRKQVCHWNTGIHHPLWCTKAGVLWFLF